MWRVNAGDEPGGSGAFKKPRQAKVLSRRIVVEENEHIAEPVPGVIDAVGYEHHDVSSTFVSFGVKKGERTL